MSPVGTPSCIASFISPEGADRVPSNATAAWQAPEAPGLENSENSTQPSGYVHLVD